MAGGGAAEDPATLIATRQDRLLGRPRSAANAGGSRLRESGLELRGAAAGRCDRFPHPAGEPRVDGGPLNISPPLKAVKIFK
jgi:hypothetical protein